MVKFLIASYQLHPTKIGQENLKHYVSPSERPKIDTTQAQTIDDVLRSTMNVTEDSVFNHVSRLVDSYQREFALPVEK